MGKKGESEEESGGGGGGGEEDARSESRLAEDGEQDSAKNFISNFIEFGKLFLGPSPPRTIFYSPCVVREGGIGGGQIVRA